MTRREALLAATRRLGAAGIADATGDARRLMSAVLKDPLALAKAPDHALSTEEALQFDAKIMQRADRIPVSHILGEREFWGRMFHVTADVLDPRPETETLIEAALSGDVPGRILDLGTGSGAIVLTLLAEWETATALATDISPAALSVARRNAQAMNVVERIEFLEGDWFEPVTGQFELVVSNPPYITADEMSSLSPEVLREPHIALSPGGDGLAAYRVLAAGLDRVLLPGGRAFLEIGAGQSNAVSEIFKAAGWTKFELLTDMDARPRLISLLKT